MLILRTSTGPITLKPSEISFLRNQIRTKLGGSLLALSNKTGIAVPHLSTYFSGRKGLSVQQLARICDGLDLSVSCQVSITLREQNAGVDVTNADYIPLEETLSSEDLESLQEDQF